MSGRVVRGWFLVFVTCFLMFVFTADMWKLRDPFSRALDVIVNTIIAACICGSIYRDRIAK